MKKIIVILIFILILSISIYIFPNINCLINKTITCTYPFYERAEIKKRLSIDKTDFIVNKDKYQWLVDLIFNNSYSTIEKSITENTILYTISWSYNPQPIPSWLKISNDNLYKIFKNIWLERISNDGKLIKIYKKIYKLDRWFVQYYLYNIQWELYKDESIIIKNGDKVINKQERDSNIRILILDDKWSQVTIEHIKFKK